VRQFIPVGAPAPFRADQMGGFQQLDGCVVESFGETHILHQLTARTCRSNQLAEPFPDQPFPPLVLLYDAPDRNFVVVAKRLIHIQQCLDVLQLDATDIGRQLVPQTAATHLQLHRLYIVSGLFYERSVGLWNGSFRQAAQQRIGHPGRIRAPRAASRLFNSIQWLPARHPDRAGPGGSGCGAASATAAGTGRVAPDNPRES
jgi:hypothetical protein